MPEENATMEEEDDEEIMEASPGRLPGIHCQVLNGFCFFSLLSIFIILISSSKWILFLISMDFFLYNHPHYTETFNFYIQNGHTTSCAHKSIQSYFYDFIHRFS